MSEGVLLEDRNEDRDEGRNTESDDHWRCDEDGCGALNPPENTHCHECDKKKPPDPPNPPGWEDEN